MTRNRHPASDEQAERSLDHERRIEASIENTDSNATGSAAAEQSALDAAAVRRGNPPELGGEG